MDLISSPSSSGDEYFTALFARRRFFETVVAMEKCSSQRQSTGLRLKDSGKDWRNHVLLIG